MPPGRETTSHLASAALALALVPVVLVSQVWGGVHPQVAVPATLMELTALALLVVAKARRGAPVVASLAGLPLLAGLVATCAMVVPLPRALRAVLSPVATDEVAWATALLPEELRTSVLPVLSLDPPETCFAVVRLVGALALFVVVCDRARHHRASTFIWRAVALCAWLVFATALAHALLGASGAWGYHLRYPGVFFAPLVNPNQLARVFGALSLACAGHALTVRGRREAFVVGGAAVCCGAGTFLTLSRGGMVAYLVGALVLVALAWRAWRGAGAAAPSWARAAVAPALVAAVLGLAAVAASDAVLREASTLGDETVERSKVQLYRPALRLLDAYGRVGTGNGAFAVAFPSTSEPRHSAARRTYTHVENVVIQTLVDHGVVVGGALLALALAVGAWLLARARGAAAVGPLAALAFLVIGDQLDFVLELEVGMLLAGLFLGLAAARVADDGAGRVELRARVGLALVAGLAAMMFWCAPRAVAERRPGLDRAIDRAIDDHAPAARTALLERALAAHPRDAQYCYHLAREARLAGDATRALAWANRAIVLSPTLRPAHVEAARALVALGHVRQALVQYKAAWQADVQPDGNLAREIFARTSDVQLRRTALPDTARDLTILCDALGREERADEALACADEVATRPDAEPAHRRRALELSLEVGDVVGTARRLELFLSDAPTGGLGDGADAVVHARALALLDGAAAARAATASWPERLRDPLPLLQWRLAQALQASDLDEAAALAERLRPLSRTPAAIDRLDRLAADLAGRRGESGRQLELLGELLERHPRDPGLLAQRGLAELALGQASAARQSLEEAAAIAPRHPGVRALQARLEGAP